MANAIDFRFVEKITIKHRFNKRKTLIVEKHISSYIRFSLFSDSKENIVVQKIKHLSTNHSQQVNPFKRQKTTST